MSSDAVPPDPVASSVAVTLRIIGRVITDFDDPATTPIQAQRGVACAGRVVLDRAFRSGLWGLDGFDYAFVVTYLDRPAPPRSDPDAWLVEPFLLAGNPSPVGTFATRHPTRPNPIGLSLVRVTRTRPDGFDFTGVDLVTGTPVLDVKPWVPAFDTPQLGWADVRTGWYDAAVLGQGGTTPTELAEGDGAPGRSV